MSDTENANTNNSTNLSGNRGCWTKFSENKLVELEKKILQVLKTTYKGLHVNIGNVVGREENKIWTLSLNAEVQKTPLVMLHGFAAGVGFWCLNLDALSEKRPVYAIDLLGFGRSSRPTFSTDGDLAEEEMIKSLEEWRNKMNIDKMILLGHSFGGYLATSYTISYPERVKHLILADPWGFTEKPPTFNPSPWLKAIAYPLSLFNPLSVLRAVGPVGPWLVKKLRSDISEKYSGVFEEKEIISEYIYQCNSQKPSGESAFNCMKTDLVFAKKPMVHRIHNLHKNIPITLIYGSESWMFRNEDMVKEKRADSYVYIEYVTGAGHHLHADQPEIFNFIVNKACEMAEEILDHEDPEDKEAVIKIDDLQVNKGSDKLKNESKQYNKNNFDDNNSTSNKQNITVNALEVTG